MIDEYSVDPRPDIEHDHRYWAKILLGASVYPDLQGRLHYIRCLGAQVQETANIYRILQGKMPDEEWEDVKTRILAPVKSSLASYFSLCRRVEKIDSDELVKEAARLFGTTAEQLTLGGKIQNVG
jgi:hypothetical protein